MIKTQYSFKPLIVLLLLVFTHAGQATKKTKPHYNSD